jgi:hypothetical protein
MVNEKRRQFVELTRKSLGLPDAAPACCADEADNCCSSASSVQGAGSDCCNSAEARDSNASAIAATAAP